MAALQSASPEAAHWVVADYLNYEFAVTVEGDEVAAFIVWRELGAGECEVLNLVVGAAFRRRGMARELMMRLLGERGRTVFLEVRESNETARNFYKSMEFKEVSIRNGYYENPSEAGIVMKFHSC